jgi:plastocyanin
MHQSHHMRLLSAVSILSAMVIAGCSTEKKEGPEKETAGTVQASAPGDTIVIETWTDETGNYFKPNEVEAHPGDVLRYTNRVGVHNVHFLPDSNTIKTGLPPASELLQLPGQTYDLVVTMAPGKYYFQCDPHAALGMKGHLEVEKKD